MPIGPQREIQILLNAYRSGTFEIVANIERMTREGRSTAHARAALKETQAVLRELDQFADTWIETNIPAAYREGWDDAFRNQFYATPDGLGANVRYQDFAKLNKEAIEATAYSLRDSLHAATQLVGRRVNDIYRRVGLEATQRRLITGEALATTTAKMKETFVSQGVTGFRDKLNREWSLDSYAEMVARTSTREATTQGTLTRLMGGGYDLVQVSEHQPTCEKCVGLGGKVFSISGGNRDYPKYNGYIPVHGNCLHVLWSYQAQFDKNAEETRRKSNTSLTEDTRSQAQKDAYKATQDKKRQERDLREQYKRYRARLGDDAGTIQSFSRAKKSDGDRWQQMQEDYRAAGRELKRA